jgi:hypothetical protein
MKRLLVLISLIAMISVTAANGAVITILNNDGVGEGFNDPTPAAPVGGNPGTTVGQQRLLVFQKAADIWGGLLPSTVTIIVRAQFNPQTCTATSAVLGSAGASEIWRNFAGAPMANTWYHVALANRLGGVDLNPGLYDINATFNSNLNGSPTCLNGTGWYLGFDGLEGSNIELLPVVLHELGHGLGFSSGIGATGVLPGAPGSPSPTLYSRFMYDNTQGLTWDNMTDAQRAASAINTGNVVWNGACANGHALSVLGDTPTTFINSDPSATLAPKYVNGSAAFGPSVYNVTGDLVLVDDGVAPNTDGCTAPVNALAGKIAVIDRGTCTFVIKAGFAQAAGAIGVIIVNNAATTTPPGLGGSDPSITIPVVSVTQASGNAIKAAMLVGTVNVTLGLDPNQLAGADSAGRVKLYAPNPYESGSSISHWDVSATPNLLMEPAINSNLSSTTDLTFWMFGDLGWHNECNNPIAVAISAFSAVPVDGGVRLRASFYSSLADAAWVTVYRAGSDLNFHTLSTVEAPADGDFAFIDDTAAHGRTYHYKIGVIDGDGEFVSQTASVTMPGAKVELSQNSPNPFNPTTTIRFSLPASERVTLAVYDARGALVRVLVDGQRATGKYDVSWDGRDNAGSPVTSGVYFYRLTAGKVSESRKMVLLK